MSDVSCEICGIDIEYGFCPECDHDDWAVAAIESLQSQLKSARCVIGYYAKTECLDTWLWQSYGDKDRLDVIDQTDLEKIDNDGRIQGYELVGGKRARQWLKENGDNDVF